MGKHRHYRKIDKKTKPTSTNCIHRNKRECEDVKPSTNERYEESREFDVFDRMMRDNRGVKFD